MKGNLMKQSNRKYTSAVRRQFADHYILISLIAFAVTVIVTRVYLHVTDYPQLGNDVLHIAHALWGGLLLVIAVYFPMVIYNRWAIKTSALLSGIGLGLFIDEIGKFITQTNDYFFPPALSLIYGFVLLNTFVYLIFRRPKRADPRDAMYLALEGLKESIDGDLDVNEASAIKAQLAIAKQSERDEIVSLAIALENFIQEESKHLPQGNTFFLRRVTAWLDKLGKRIGERVHRKLITWMLILWIVFVIGYLILLIQGGDSIDPKVLEWRYPLIMIQVGVGTLMISAFISWYSKKEERGVKLAVSGILLSLVALQTLYFYLSQYSAVTATLVQFVFLQILLTYRRWHLAVEAS